MKKFKKLGLVFATTTLTALLAVGCSSPSEEAEGGGLDQYTAEDPVTIKFWNFPNFTGDTELAKGDYDRALIAAFEEEHPNIKIDFQEIEFTDGPSKLETAIQSKTNPDVVYDAPGRVIDWASKDYLIDLEDIVDKDSLLESAVTASSYDGEIYMYPQGVAPFLMGFNQDLLEELDLLDRLPLDEPNRQWNVEEYEGLLREIKEARPDLSPTILFAKSQSGDQGPRAFISNLYGSWITDDAVTEYTINDAEGVQALEWAKAAYDDDLLGKGIALDGGESIEEFRSGLAASTILYSPGLYKPDAEEGSFEPLLIPFPNNSGQPELEYLVAGPAIFDNEDEAKAEASKLFVDFMINDEDWGRRTLLSTGNFSAKKGETGLYDDPELVYAETLSEFFGPYYNTIPGFAQMRALWFPMMQGVLNGDMTPQEGLDQFVEDANATIEDAQ